MVKPCRELRVEMSRLATLLLVFATVGTCCTAEEGLPSATREAARVKAKAYLSVKKLPPGGECEIIVLVAVEAGWHINSHSVQKEWQIPTELSISSKLGTKLVSHRLSQRQAGPGAGQRGTRPGV